MFHAIFQVLDSTYLIFQVLECFSPYSRSYSVHFSFSTYLSVSRYIPGQTVVVSYFPRFFQFSCHNTGPTVCISHFSRFSLFSSYSRPYSVFLVLHIFQCFLLYSRSYHVSFSFSSFVSFSLYSMSYSVCVSFLKLLSFLVIIVVLECVFHIFHLF
jgi:hypothetical protein